MWQRKQVEELIDDYSEFFESYNEGDEPYHIDYVYAAKGIITYLEIGDADRGLELSNHMPITFEF